MQEHFYTTLGGQLIFQSARRRIFRLLSSWALHRYLCRQQRAAAQSEFSRGLVQGGLPLLRRRDAKKPRGGAGNDEDVPHRGRISGRKGRGRFGLCRKFPLRFSTGRLS